MFHSRAEEQQIFLPVQRVSDQQLTRAQLIKPMLPKIGLNIGKFATDNSLVLGLMAYVMFSALSSTIGNRLKDTGVETLEHYLNNDNLNATVTFLCSAFTTNLTASDKDFCLETLPKALPWLLPRATSIIEDLPLEKLAPYTKKIETYLFLACVVTAVLKSIISPATGVAKNKALTRLARRAERPELPNVTETASRSFGMARITDV